MDAQYSQELSDIIESQISPQEEREGVHVSDLILCLDKTYHSWTKGTPSLDLPTKLLFHQGHAFQSWMTGKLEDEPTIELDGILLSPDWFVENVGGEPLYCEIKSTYMSSKNETPAHWLVQMMAYAKALDVLKFGLVRLNLMGNYKWIHGKKEEKAEAEHPTLTPLIYYFTQEEVDSNWNWLSERRDVLLKGLNEGKPPSWYIPDYMGPTANGGWQCKKCLQRDVCS